LIENKVLFVMNHFLIHFQSFFIFGFFNFFASSAFYLLPFSSYWKLSIKNYVLLPSITSFKPLLLSSTLVKRRIYWISHSLIAISLISTFPLFILAVKVLNSDALGFCWSKCCLYYCQISLSETSLDNAPSPLFILVA
jgi:hypothetical protein